MGGGLGKGEGRVILEATVGGGRLEEFEDFSHGFGLLRRGKV